VLLKIAFRNIFRQKRRTILTALTMFGGFTLAAISIGWADGSYSFIIDMFTRNQLGHIQIHAQGYRDRPSIYKTIDDYKDIGAQLQSIKHLESWTPRVYSAGLLSAGDKSAGARLIGIDPRLENQTVNFNKKIFKGSAFSDSAAHETIIGKGLAKTLEADVGDSIVFVSQAADGSIANDIYKVVALIDAGNNISNRMSFYLHIDDAQEVLVLNHRIHEIAVVCSSLDVVKDVAQRIRSQLGDHLEVAPWQEFAKHFYQAMKADKQGMWIMLFVVILIVAVGVLNTVLMSVLERQEEYGLLKAVGTRPGSIFTLVLYEVNILAFFSIIIGIVLSIIANSIIAERGISLPQAFTYGGVEFKTMYSEVNLRSLYIPAITVMLAASLVCILPALRAARTEPARTMRL
jgi:ABC-type lipoprotein release transport system permease subunit